MKRVIPIFLIFLILGAISCSQAVEPAPAPEAAVSTPMPEQAEAVIPSPSPAPIHEPTEPIIPSLPPEPTFGDIGAFIAEPDWEPSWTQEQIAEVKANIDSHFGSPYYTKREYYMNIYEPYDIAKLEKALTDLGKLPWSYEAAYFDCSEMSAIVELYLEMSHFQTVIIVGSNPEAQGAGHAWVVTYVRDPEYKAIPVEATTLSIPEPTGNLFGEPPNQTVMNYEDFLDNGWTLRDIYEAITYEPDDFDWWNSYPVSINELFGEPVQAIMPDDPNDIPQILPARGAAIKPWFSWNAVEWATGYEFELALDPDFTLIIESVSLTTTEYMCQAELAYSSTYYWRIKGISPTGESNWATGTFTTKASPPPPVPPPPVPPPTSQ